MFCVRFKGSEAWLGLDGVDIPNGERHWVWEQGFQSSFTNWAGGQPRNHHCAVYEAGSASWKSADCYRPKTYICKRGKNLKGCINYDAMVKSYHFHLEINPCKPSRCPDHEECVVTERGKSYKCVCHHCCKLPKLRRIIQSE